MIGGIDVEAPKRIQRIFFEPVFVPDLICASGVDVDRTLREKRQHAADIGDHPVYFWEALQYPTVNQPSHCHGAVERPAENQGWHNVDAYGFCRQRRGRMNVNRELILRQPLINRKQLFTIQSLAV